MKTEALPRVGVIEALATGLVEAGRRPWLMIIPLLVEITLWLAPQLSIVNLVSRTADRALQQMGASGQVTATAEQISSLRDELVLGWSPFNVLEGINGGWLGVPSALTGTQVTRMTFVTDLVLAPAGLAIQLPRMGTAPWRGAPIEITNGGTFLLMVAGFWLIGQVLVAVYLRWAATSWRNMPPLSVTAPIGARATAARAATAAARRVAADRAGSPEPAVPAPPAAPWTGLGGLAKLSGRLVLYSILVGVIVTVLQVPLVLAYLMITQPSSGSLVGLLMLLFGGIALWLTLWFLVSLFFVTEGIVLDGQPVLRSVLRSVVLVHNNFWPTLSLAVLINLLMYGFRAAWGLIGNTTVGATVALVTNAYLATGMLLAIFAFYQSLCRTTGVRRVLRSKT